jgi:hypothetical protein
MGNQQMWILGFDASCGTCQCLTEVVARECGKGSTSGP